MRVEALAGDASPAQVLHQLARRARSRRIPPPAALVGDWFGGGAVLAPSVLLAPSAGLPELPSCPGPPGAVGGGWIGYLGYGRTEPAADRSPAPRRLPLAVGGRTDHVLRLDRAGQWWYESLAEPPPGLIAELAAVVSAGPAGPADRASWRVGEWQWPDVEAHHKAVRAALAEIAAGEVYQVNVCTRFEATFAGDPLDVAVAGLERLGARRSAVLAGDWGAVASFSPELFLARHGRAVRTEPIKGTAPRRGPGDDGLALALRASVKDVAENVMIVDMARNDLGRVCVTGSVAAPRLLDVQPHPGVWHLVSTVTGRLADGASDAELLAATFPPASVTGTPKIRALELIAELETAPREVYCGVIGMASPVAGTELNVAIRTLEFAGDRVWFGVGGGITADSVPDLEWAECETKAAPLLDLLRR